MPAPDRRFEQLVADHVDLVFHVALGLCGNAADAEEVAQVAFVKAWRSFRTFEVGTSFRAWILAITRNAATDQLRARQTRRGRALPLQQVPPDLQPETPVEPPQVFNAADGSVGYELFSDEIARLLRTIPMEYSVAVVLCDVEQMTYRDMADVLGVPIGTIRSRVHRGRALLADLLRRHGISQGYLGGETP